jgi:hypothetical protein
MPRGNVPYHFLRGLHGSSRMPPVPRNGQSNQARGTQPRQHNRQPYGLAASDVNRGQPAPDGAARGNQKFPGGGFPVRVKP